MVGPALRARPHVVDREIAELKRIAAAVADALLPAEQPVLLCAVGWDDALVGALWNVRAMNQVVQQRPSAWMRSRTSFAAKDERAIIIILLV